MYAVLLASCDTFSHLYPHVTQPTTRTHTHITRKEEPSTATAGHVPAVPGRSLQPARIPLFLGTMFRPRNPASKGPATHSRERVVSQIIGVVLRVRAKLSPIHSAKEDGDLCLKLASMMARAGWPETPAAGEYGPGTPSRSASSPRDLPEPPRITGLPVPCRDRPHTMHGGSEPATAGASIGTRCC